MLVVNDNVPFASTRYWVLQVMMGPFLIVVVVDSVVRLLVAASPL
jgi:hypothetical protein